MRALGAGPDRVAKTIERVLKRRNPPARIRITPSAKLMLGLRRVLPDRAWEAMMRAQFPHRKAKPKGRPGWPAKVTAVAAGTVTN
jgi:hypothetical protein